MMSVAKKGEAFTKKGLPGGTMGYEFTPVNRNTTPLGDIAEYFTHPALDAHPRLAL